MIKKRQELADYIKKLFGKFETDRLLRTKEDLVTLQADQIKIKNIPPFEPSIGLGMIPVKNMTKAEIRSLSEPDMQQIWMGGRSKLYKDILGASGIAPGYPDYMEPPSQPEPVLHPIEVEMTLEDFSTMPCKSPGEMIVALKMRQRLAGNDMDKYKNMVITIDGSSVKIIFRPDSPKFAYGVSASAEISRYQGSLMDQYDQAAKQMAEYIDRQILDNIKMSAALSPSIEIQKGVNSGNQNSKAYSWQTDSGNTPEGRKG